MFKIFALWLFSLLDVKMWSENAKIPLFIFVLYLQLYVRHSNIDFYLVIELVFLLLLLGCLGCSLVIIMHNI